MEKKPPCICLDAADKHNDKGCKVMKREYGLQSNVGKDVKCRCTTYIPVTIWSGEDFTIVPEE